MYEFDLKTLYKVILSKRKQIVINCSIAFVVAVIIGYSIPKEYSSSATLLPEFSGEQSMGGLSSLASAAGFDLGSTNETLTPNLYPDVVNSNKFIIDLLYVDIETTDGIKTNYLTYTKEYTRSPWWGYIIGGISKGIKNLFSKDTIQSGISDKKIDPFRISPEELLLIKGLRNQISCVIDKTTQNLTLSMSCQDPLVAATMVDSIKTHLQKFIIEYNTNKAKLDFEYYCKLEQEARVKYDVAQEIYSKFCDTHNGLVLQSFNSERERLHNDVQLAFTTYSQMVQNKHIAAAKVQKYTPAFTELEGPFVATRHDSPKKMLIAIGLVFIAFVGTLISIYLKLLFSK